MNRTSLLLAGRTSAYSRDHRLTIPIACPADPAHPGDVCASRAEDEHPRHGSKAPLVVAASLLAWMLVLSASSAAEAARDLRWRFDETSGTQVASTSEPVVMGTLGSSARLDSGLMGGAVHLAPTGDYDANAHVELPAQVGQLGNRDFTIMFWYKTSFSRPGYHGDVLGNRRESSHGNYLSIRLLGDGTLGVEISEDAQGRLYKAMGSGTVRINDGVWHHIALTRQAAILRLYIDGAPVAQEQIPPANLTGIHPFRIGRSLPNCCSNFVSIPGSYDDLQIHAAAGHTALIHSEFEAGGAGLVSALAKRFAPQLRFDKAGSTFPMSAQDFYAQIIATGTWKSSHKPYQNKSISEVTGGRIPTYYQVTTCGSQIRIRYWWFYGYQPECSPGAGAHNGDWERVIVTLNQAGTEIAAVSFYQHSGWYTRLAERDGFKVHGGTHPIVHVGKNSHGSYHDQGGTGTCLYYEDWRNYGNNKHMDTWMNLVSLEQDNEPWMAQDRKGGFQWGHDGVGTHPTKSGFSCSMDACKGKDGKTQGCSFSKSHCKLGDNGDGTKCWVDCKKGYTDMGVTCTNWKTFHTYNQEGYGYNYTLPAKDAGLTR